MGILSNYGFPPNEMIRSSISRLAVDSCVAFRVKYVGSEASGLLQIANTTGDLSFEHGDLGSEAADTTVNANGSTPGTIDLSGEAATFRLIERLVNLSPNWELWYECALPTDASEASGTAKIVNNLSDKQCKVDGGYAVLIDTSTALYHSIGVTSQDQSSNLSGSDAGWYHEITQIVTGSTYASGTSTLNIYKVLDSSGTVTLLDSHTGSATPVGTKLTIPSGGEQWPTYNTQNHRLVVKLVNSAAMTAATAAVYFGSYKFAPSTRKSRTWSEKSI